MRSECCLFEFVELYIMSWHVATLTALDTTWCRTQIKSIYSIHYLKDYKVLLIMITYFNRSSITVR